MDNNEIRIVIADQTSDNRLSKPDVEQKVAEASTKPKTSVAKQQDTVGFKNAAKSFGSGVANKASGGLYGQTTSIVAGIGSAMTLATLALTAVDLIWKMIEEQKQKDQQRQNNSFRAGGSYRSGGNIVNSRVSITGKISGQQVNYRR